MALCVEVIHRPPPQAPPSAWPFQFGRLDLRSPPTSPQQAVASLRAVAKRAVASLRNQDGAQDLL